MLIRLQSPLLQILTDVGLIPREQILGIAPAKRRFRPEIRLEREFRNRLLEQVLAEVNVCIVLLIVQDDLIIEDYLVALLSVLVARLDLECDATSDRRVC